MFKPTKPALLFSLRALISSLIAWLLALHWKFESPYWASITVWVVAQPSRGMTLSKGAYRMLGTCLGAIAAVLMIRYLAPHPWLFVTCLALWCGACSAVAVLVLYFRSYAAVLASFTCAIVALLAFTHTEHVFEVARERVLCVFIGIAVVGISSSFFARSRSKEELFARMRASIVTTMRWLSLVCSRASPQVKAALERQLVAEAEAIQELTDYASTESLQIRIRRARVHSLLASLFSTLSAVRAWDSYLERRPDLEAHSLAALARDIEEQARSGQDFSLNALIGELRRMQGQARSQQGLMSSRIDDLRVGIERLAERYDALIKESEKRQPPTHLSHHRDAWIARMAGLRAAVGILIAGAIWLFSGWSGGPLLVMMAAVWCSVFAARPDPAAAIVTLIKSSLWACVAAFVTARYLLPADAPLWQNLAWQAIFLFPGALQIAAPGTALVGSFYTSNYILFLSPAYPAVFSLERFIAIGLGFFAGTTLSWSVFRLILPARPDQQLEGLRRKIVLDLQALARVGSRPTTHTEWETRTYHRLSRLITVSSDQGRDASSLVSGGMAALQIGRDLLKISSTESIDSFKTISSVSADPEKTARELRARAAELRESTNPDLPQVDLLEEMAKHLTDHVKFFALRD